MSFSEWHADVVSTDRVTLRGLQVREALMTARQDVALPLWCNGSTVLFGSKSLGSSPGRGAEQRQRIEGAAVPLRFALDRFFVKNLGGAMTAVTKPHGVTGCGAAW